MHIGKVPSVKRTYSLTIPIPSLRGQFGDRLNVFQAMIRPRDIEGLLGHDPRSKFWNRLPEDLAELYQYLQRKTAKSRRDSLGRYIKDRILGNLLTIGAFPALAIGMTHPARFEPDDEGSPVGTLYFDLSQRVKRVLLDGLGRVSAALDMLDEGDLDLDEKLTFMVSIYAPSEAKKTLSMEELGQLFHDFNFLAEPVSKGQAVDLDQSNIYISLTNILAKAPVIEKNGGIERRAASLGAKSTALVAKQVFLKFVKSACEGDTRYIYILRRTPANGNLSAENIGYLANQIERRLEIVAAQMGERFKDRDSILLSASGWGALGLVFFDLESLRQDKVLDEREEESFLRAIGKLDWSRYNQDWINYLGGSDRDEAGRPRLGKVFGGRAIERIADYVRKKIGLTPLLKNENIVTAARSAGGKKE